METFDTQKLIAEVAARHGVLLKSNDAAFALVTMNQIVLEETLKTAGDEIQTKIDRLDESVQRVQRLAGKILAREVKTSTAAARREISNEFGAAKSKLRDLMAEAKSANGTKMSAKWWALGVIASILIFIGGFFAGQFAKLL